MDKQGDVPSWKWKVEVALSQSKVARAVGLKWDSVGPHVWRMDLASKGFEILGRDGRAAIPDLLLRLRGTNEVAGMVAWGALTSMREESALVLLDLLTNKQSYALRPLVRTGWAMRGLNRLGADGRVAAAELQQIARDSDDEMIREAATAALHDVAPDLRVHGMRTRNAADPLMDGVSGGP